MPGHTLHTEIEIDAPPERVWRVLTDFTRWPEWNPMLQRLELHGPFEEGTPIRLAIAPKGRPKIKARLVTVRENRELAWEGGFKDVMLGCHGLRLVPTEKGTRLVHTENFSGVLAPLFLRLAQRRLMKGYRALNRRLCERAEQA